MRKQIFTFLVVSAFVVHLNAQSLLPDPALSYSCDEITNTHELAPAVGSITAVITDGQSATSYKTDASVENDAERGQVLYLPNTVDANGKGDGAAYYRSLRIISGSSLVGAGDFTISFWSKVKTQTTLNGFPAVFDFDGMSSGRSFTMRNVAWWNSSKLSLRFNDGATKDLNVAADPAGFIYNWTHYVVVKKGTVLSLYINSILQTSNSTYALANSELKQLRFNGQAHAGGSLFDDIRIYHEALNIDQIVELNTGVVATPSSQTLATFETGDTNLLTKVDAPAYAAGLFSEAPSVATNIAPTGINTSDRCYKAVNVADADWWGNFGQLDLSSPVIVSDDNRFLKFQAYRSVQPKGYRVYFNSRADENIIYEGSLSADATWEDVVLDLGAFKGKTLSSVFFIFSLNWTDPRSGWGEATYMFDNFQLSNTSSTSVSISVEKYPEAGGIITGTGIYQAGNTATLTATANEGYTFAYWLSDGVQISTDPVYNIPLNITSDKTQSYLAYFKKNDQTYSTVYVDGNYYEIEDLQETRQIFRNRDNMPLMEIPADFSGWKYLKISARSGYNPIGNGEAPEFDIKIPVTGYVYAMVANYEQPENAASWATDNDWELVPVYSLAYGENDPAKVLSFYKKELTGGSWYTMVFPDVFSRATIIAPAIQEGSLTTGAGTPEPTKVKISETVYTLTGMRISSKIEDLAEGIYMIRSRYDDGTFETRKIIK